MGKYCGPPTTAAAHLKIKAHFYFKKSACNLREDARVCNFMLLKSSAKKAVRSWWWWCGDDDDDEDDDDDGHDRDGLLIRRSRLIEKRI